MPAKRIFEHSTMDDGVLDEIRSGVEPLVSRTDSGLTVVEVLGARAIVGVNYTQESGLWSYIVAKRTYGIYVAMHRTAIALADCASNGCVAAGFMEGMTEIEVYDTSELTLAKYRAVQDKAGDAIDDLTMTGHMAAHNPFVGAEAYETLAMLADYHPDDELLQALAAEVTEPV